MELSQKVEQKDKEMDNRKEKIIKIRGTVRITNRTGKNRSGEERIP